MATAVKTAEKTLETARTTVRQWQDKAAGARAEAAELDANSGALILADPSTADDIAGKIHATEVKARTFDAAATEARKQLAAARRALLEAWAAQYDKDATKARQDYDAHKAKIDDLLAQLKELDGWEYKATDVPTGVGITYTWAKSATLADRHSNAANSAAIVRFYLEHGKLPIQVAHLRPFGGIGHSFQSVADVVDSWPPAVLADQSWDDMEAAEDAPTDGVDVDLDPAEDADLIAAMGGAR